MHEPLTLGGERKGGREGARMKGVREKHPGLPTVELRDTKKDEWASDEEWV